MTSPGLPDPPVGADAPDPADAVLWLAESPAALLTLDAAGHVHWANAACLVLVGGLANGLPLATQLGLDGSGAQRLRTTLQAGGCVDLQRHEHGSVATHLRLDVRIASGGQRLVTLSAVDGEHAVREEAQRLRELLDLARSMGRQIFRMRGMDGEGPAPDFSTAVDTTLEADRVALETAYRQSLLRAGSYAHRYRVLGLDGRVRQLHSQWIVKNGSDGQPERVIGLLMDDTQAWALARSYDELVSQLALAVDLAGIVVWRHDLASSRMHYNDQGFALLDMPPRSDGIPIVEVRALIHPDDLPQVLASAEAALHNDKPADLEARYRRGDGSYRTVLMRRALQRDADGKPVAFIGVALDVSERLEAQRRAVELGRRFELATRAAGIGYWSLEDEAGRARWSDQLRAIHGLLPDAPVPMLREWLDKHVHPDDRKDVKRRFADWVASGRSTLESAFRVLRTDGEARQVITHSRVEVGERGPLLFGLVTDVTERRSVEMALHQAGERAALAARGAGIGAWEIDARGEHVFWDEQMWRLRGRQPRVQPPSATERLAMVHAGDRAAVSDINDNLFSSDRPTNHEFRVVLPDGRERWLASRSTPVRDDHGNTVRRIGVNWDVTDRHTAEAVRQEREIAQRESQAKSKFLARMSHELRTPLNAVLGFAQLLLAEDTGDDAAAMSRRRRLEHIRSAGQHLLELINDVLDLSSLEGGEVKIILQPVPLAPLIAATLPLLEPLLRAHGNELVTGALDAVPLADATRLRQVLLNLLSNAVKYNRPGGRVIVDALRRGGNVLVRVSDTGRGLTDQQMLHLFEPFNRLGIEREGIEGTGIGLAIVKALVERMGGSVHVDSTLGEGSVFELRLADGSDHPPQPPPGPPKSRPIPLADAHSAPRGTLLYVEDNPVNALIISELIARRADLRLHIAEDGISGVAMATELQPDLILLDMQLPDIDGHEVLRRLRAQAPTANIPVIALSANAMPEDIDRALHAGMSDYWTKPLDFRAFMASIDALFGPG